MVEAENARIQTEKKKQSGGIGRRHANDIHAYVILVTTCYRSMPLMCHSHTHTPELTCIKCTFPDLFFSADVCTFGDKRPLPCATAEQHRFKRMSMENIFSFYVFHIFQFENSL